MNKLADQHADKRGEKNGPALPAKGEMKVLSGSPWTSWLRQWLCTEQGQTRMRELLDRRRRNARNGATGTARTTGPPWASLSPKDGPQGERP
jgi:hypothetical protein